MSRGAECANFSSVALSCEEFMIASQDEQNGANFSFIAPSSEEL